jgi:hypothetical protein
VRHDDTLAARVGIEPYIGFIQACIQTMNSERAKALNSQLHAQGLSELGEVITAWPTLPRELRIACLAMTRSAIARHHTSDTSQIKP